MSEWTENYTSQKTAESVINREKRKTNTEEERKGRGGKKD